MPICGRFVGLTSPVPGWLGSGSTPTWGFVLLVVTALSRARMRVAGTVLSLSLTALITATALVAAPAVLAPRTTVVHAATVRDVTTTTKAQRSATYRAKVTLARWQASTHGKRISWRESHDVCAAMSADGRFRGKWQMTQSLWDAHGGRAFARSPQRATCQEQDRIARRVWVASWWWPWGG